MISLKSKLLACILIVFCLTLAGCIRNGQQKANFTLVPSIEKSPDPALPTRSTTAQIKPTITSPSSATTMLTSTAIVYFSSTPTINPLLILPTMYPDRERDMYKLLQAKDCELPCYLGITPGKSSWEETKGLLTNLGAYSWMKAYGIEEPDSKFFENGWPIYEYHLNPRDPAITPVAYDWDWGYIDQYVAFTVAENEVKRIKVSITTQRIGGKYREYWKRYALEEVLRRLGEPDHVFLGASESNLQYSIHIVYEKLSAVMEYDGLLKDNRGWLCPLQPIKDGSWMNLKMTLTDSTTPLSIYQPSVVPPTNRAVYLPIEDALGISAKEFYNRLRSDPAACFEIKEFPR